MGVTYPAVHAEKVGSQKLLLTLGVDKCWEAFALLDKERGAGYLKVELSRPGKPRTTGEGSQNHAINGAVQIMAKELGYGFDEMKTALKMEAISRGYPFRTILGKVVPYSETELTTMQAGHLIETIIQIAAENNIRVEVGRE